MSKGSAGVAIIIAGIGAGVGYLYFTGKLDDILEKFREEEEEEVDITEPEYEDEGDLSILIVDKDENPIEGVEMTLDEIDRKKISTKEGVVFKDLPSGEYTVNYRKKNYVSRQEKSDVVGGYTSEEYIVLHHEDEKEYEPPKPPKHWTKGNVIIKPIDKNQQVIEDAYVVVARQSGFTTKDGILFEDIDVPPEPNPMFWVLVKKDGYEPENVRVPIPPERTTTHQILMWKLGEKPPHNMI